MPIHKAGSGYQWGDHGHIYPTRAGAEKQAAAAHAHGFQDAADTPQCAGLLLVTQDREFLLLKRTDRDEWEGPGGHVKEGESDTAAAIRECFEEVGPLSFPMPDPVFIRTTAEYGCLYAIYAQRVDRFTPVLNEEHSEARWVTAHELPETTHPGTRAAIESIAGNERAIAESIQTGLFPSPQRINDLWLFDLRVTGTGVSFRPQLNEWVYRPPEFYLCPEFLERCNGVPVIFNHPEKSSLNTEEWRERAIGALILPYIPVTEDDKHRIDEVWSIARIYDSDAAELMMTTHTSTSPSVKFETEGSTQSVLAEDGNLLLIEGNPSFLCHVAVCSAGVWDQGGAPRGINY